MTVEPPDTNRNSAWLAVFWFLQHHNAVHGGPYTFRTQQDLARAVGVAPSVITRLKQAAESGSADWIEFKPNSIRPTARTVPDSNSVEPGLS